MGEDDVPLLDVLLAGPGGTDKTTPTAPAVLFPIPAGTAALLPTELSEPALVKEGVNPTLAVLLFSAAGTAAGLV